MIKCMIIALNPIYNIKKLMQRLQLYHRSRNKSAKQHTRSNIASDRIYINGTVLKVGLLNVIKFRILPATPITQIVI
jgi:hypothetical protein